MDPVAQLLTIAKSLPLWAVVMLVRQAKIYHAEIPVITRRED